MSKLVGSQEDVVAKIGEVTQGIGLDQLPVEDGTSPVAFAEYVSEVNQIPSVDFTVTPIEVVDTLSPIPEITLLNDSEFTFNTNKTALVFAGLTVGRTGGGGQPERLWFWVQIRTETDPDVWTNIGFTTVTGLTSVTTFTINIAFSILNAQGLTLRFVMESEDASELIGVFAETAANNHPSVPSVRLEFNFF